LLLRPAGDLALFVMGHYRNFNAPTPLLELERLLNCRLADLLLSLTVCWANVKEVIVTLEHIALNIPEPKAAASWYAKHLGLRMVRSIETAPFIHFLADDKGSLIEVYHNPLGKVPDYAQMSPYTLHLAFSSGDIAADSDRLVAAGANRAGELETTAVGDQLLFLRDPWGVCIQLVKRAKAIV
jgi:glyoxylase I family protein